MHLLMTVLLYRMPRFRMSSTQHFGTPPARLLQPSPPQIHTYLRPETPSGRLLDPSPPHFPQLRCETHVFHADGLRRGRGFTKEPIYQIAFALNPLLSDVIHRVFPLASGSLAASHSTASPTAACAANVIDADQFGRCRCGPLGAEW